MPPSSFLPFFFALLTLYSGLFLFPLLSFLLFFTFVESYKCANPQNLSTRCRKERNRFIEKALKQMTMCIVGNQIKIDKKTSHPFYKATQLEFIWYMFST